MSEYPIPIPHTPITQGRSSVPVIVRAAPEKNVGISEEKIAAHYTFPRTFTTTPFERSSSGRFEANS
jgi:hypothetical protein